MPRFPPTAAAVAVACLAALAWAPPAVDRREGPREGDEAWHLARPAPAVALRPDRLRHLEGLSCAECHAEIVAEWSTTAHGISWEDEVYRAEIENRKRPELCHGCHVPEPVMASGSPLARVRARGPEQEPLHHGVSCATCHLGPGGAFLGPTGAPTDAHATAASEYLRGPGTSELCAACHATNIGPVIGVAKDFQESGQAERGRSCVGCHVHPEPGAGDDARRSHLLQTPRDPSFLRRAFHLSYDAEKDRVVVENRAGHRVPGLIGREIVLRAEALDEAGKVVGKGELRINALTYLEVDGRLFLPLDVLGRRVHVVGLHQDPRAEAPVEFLREELDVRR